MGVMMLDVMGFRAQACAVMPFERLLNRRCLANVAHLLPHQARIGSMPQYEHEAAKIIYTGFTVHRDMIDLAYS